MSVYVYIYESPCRDLVTFGPLFFPFLFDAQSEFVPWKQCYTDHRPPSDD